MLCTAESSFRVRRDFPPVAELKAARACGQPWPTVVIHTLARKEYRPDIEGPLSLFVNLRGTGRTKLGQRWLDVDAASFAVSDAGQTFTLEYEHPVEVLNFYFADDWVKDITEGARGLSSPSRLGLRDARLDAAVDRILPLLSDTARDELALEQALFQVLVLVLEGERERRWLQQPVASRTATREELRRRLGQAIDHMVAFGNGPLTLTELARAACLSKYHFLRNFKAFTGVTPARYLNRLRVERAQQILRRQSDVPLSEVARLVGFSEPAALSRAFQRLVGVRPGGYRAAFRDSQSGSSPFRRSGLGLETRHELRKKA
jgi:AraC family transcriptional regulator